ncbi:MAG: hypothetical protein EHM59_18520 [Betaproteobacteria bacterium]|nr:MAG: hypothetical protein EHM59_18520 [Betaproteobacteria bacterium]
MDRPDVGPRKEHNATSLDIADGTPEQSIGHLVGQVYEAAPAPERRRLIEHLLQPLSLMALLAVANGVFAKLWFRRGWEDLHIRLEDTQFVTDNDITALVNFVQQVSAETIAGLGQVIASSPAWSASAAGALLLAALARRFRSRNLDFSHSAESDRIGR